jgi:hypothetical protein
MLAYLNNHTSISPPHLLRWFQSSTTYRLFGLSGLTACILIMQFFGVEFINDLVIYLSIFKFRLAIVLLKIDLR